MTEAVARRGSDVPQPALTAAAADVPPNVLMNARAAIAARRPDVTVAELVQDSRDVPGHIGDDVCLDFAGGGLRIAVVLRRGSTPAKELVVEVEPPVLAAPEVRPWHSTAVTLDAAGPGRWVSPAVPEGPVSIWLSADGRHVRTAWSRF